MEDLMRPIGSIVQLLVIVIRLIGKFRGDRR
jgi:hypothetical protein